MRQSITLLPICFDCNLKSIAESFVDSSNNSECCNLKKKSSVNKHVEILFVPKNC